MKDKGCRRIVVLLLGLCAWILYIFQNEMANYGIYTIVSFQAHEILSAIPLLFTALTFGWLFYIFTRSIKNKEMKSSGRFCVVLLVLVLAQAEYLYSGANKISTTTIATIESSSEREQEITIQTSEGQVTLQCPMLVQGLLEVGEKEYGITYEWSRNRPSEGKLHMIQAIENNATQAIDTQ